MSPVNVSTIGAYIREQREQARISLRQLAQAAGVSNPYLSQIERGLRRPSADILQQIAKGLRISAEALYVQAGFLEDRPTGSAVRDAVLTDADLNERQKQVLIEIYESFRKETATATVQGGAPADDGAPALAWPAELEPAALARWAVSADGQLTEQAQQSGPAAQASGPGGPHQDAGPASWPWADADAGPDGEQLSAGPWADDLDPGRAPAAGHDVGKGHSASSQAPPAPGSLAL